MDNRVGDWIQLYPSGRQFWPLDPRPEEIEIEDIAHALSMQCRFGGHCRAFFSVAQHCCHVSDHVPTDCALWGLLHDASEAYLVDLPRPIKRGPGMEVYRSAEQILMQAVCERFGLPREQPECVKVVDGMALTTEARDLLKPPPAPWGLGQGEEVKVLPITIKPWEPLTAFAEFLSRFAQWKVN